MDTFLEHSQQYQLGTWKVCPLTNTLSNQSDSNKTDSNNTDTHSIDNKSMQVLLFLMQHAGEQVTKAQIFEHVWKGSVVADDILSVSVSKIRKALGDNARSPTFIKTIPGVGYVLIAEVIKIDRTVHKTTTKTLSARLYIAVLILLLIASLGVAFLNATFYSADEDSISNRFNIKSIAVLPFDDLSGERDNQYFTDGLSDAIINQLAQIKSLKVISRYSSFTYRGKYNPSEIGKALKVDTLLDGSVQTVGEQIRINVRIFSTKNGQQLWSKTFTFDSENLNSFKLQDNISVAIQEIIQPDFNSGSEPADTINAQAYEWYLMGQYHWRQRNPKSLNKAVTYFKHSLELEPDYAEAHVGLSITYAFLHDFGNWSENRALDTALPHINKALVLKPDSATALAAKGMLLSNKALYQARLGDSEPSLYQQAEQAFLRSLELENNATTHHWYSTLLKRMGKDSEVIQHMNQAIELNPLSASMKRSFSFYLQSLGKRDTAQRMFQRAFSLEPDNFSRVIDAAKMFRHSPQSVMDTARWQVANAELISNCASVEYCEQLVLMYLSIGANQAAQNILSKMWSRHTHFRDSLYLIAAGLNGEDQKIVSHFESLAAILPDNKKVLFNLAVAQFRVTQFRQAQKNLLQLYPEWRTQESFEPGDITVDNYLALVLYAATLSNLDKKDSAETLLKNLQAFLKQDKVFNKVEAEFTLAEINAQLNNTPQALQHLASALELGWLEYYDREWWPLQTNHLLRPLHNKPEFQLLLEQHQQQLDHLRREIANILN